MKLIDENFKLFGATVRAGKYLYDFELTTPLAFIVGNESEGLRKPILDLCTDLVKIPMAPGQSSLNVGVATGILLYELVRLKRSR